MMRALVITAAMGAGHTQVAGELARRLRARGTSTDVVDVLALAGDTGERLRRTYRTLLYRAPWLYDAAMRFWARFPPPLERLTAARSHDVEDALAATVAARQPDVVVSTYNLASQALGRLAVRHAITAPVVTLVTDPGAHPYWVSPAVDLHIAPLPETATALRGMGAARVVVAPPVVRPGIVRTADPAGARRALRLAQRRTALVTAGSWAAGAVRRTVAALTPLADLSVVVLCGRDERLRHALATVHGVTPIGWTEDVPRYLEAADVVVDNAGGLTCWESLALGTPVVLFHPLPGHGRFNAATLERAGVARLARSRAELRAAVCDPGPRPHLDLDLASAELHVLAAAARAA